uniref:Uncharacterized protein n=1 Tax=Cacopsylla melanoneura TaxID=428564 RepID=A0A8D8TFR0_9HEMI
MTRQQARRRKEENVETVARRGRDRKKGRREKEQAVAGVVISIEPYKLKLKRRMIVLCASAIARQSTRRSDVAATVATRTQNDELAKTNTHWQRGTLNTVR